MSRWPPRSIATSTAPEAGQGASLRLLGNSFDAARGLDGALDEVRISVDVKPAEWIALQVAAMTGAGVVRRDAAEPRP